VIPGRTGYDDGITTVGTDSSIAIVKADVLREPYADTTASCFDEIGTITARRPYDQGLIIHGFPAMNAVSPEAIISATWDGSAAIVLSGTSGNAQNAGNDS
jgi:hypothetical protein